MTVAELKERIGAELERLSRALTDEIPEALAAARDDRSHATMIQLQKRTQQRVRWLGQLMAGLAQIDAAAISPDHAGFGSRVEVEDLETGEVHRYTLMAGALVDVDAGHVSLASPIGQALLGRRAGDVVSAATPQGERRFRVLVLETLPRWLVGAVPARKTAPLAPA